MATNKRRLAKIRLNTVLITRPYTSAIRTKPLFEAAGFSTWVAPVFNIIPLLTELTFTTYDALITTSQAAIEILATRTSNRSIPLFCAGKASCDIARSLGFQHIYYPESPGATELVVLLKKSSFSSFAYLSGEIIKVDISRELREFPEYHIDTFCIYKTSPVTAWNDDTLALFKANKINLISFFSEHTADLTLNLMHKHDLIKYTPTIQALCLSKVISHRISPYFWKNINIASTTEGLIATLVKEH